jgi:glycosyltransferase involved in cell wall biosynthesis
VAAGIGRERLALVHNGISTQRQPSDGRPVVWDSQRTKVLFIGRLDRQKGCDLLIEAARQLGELVDVRMIGSPVVGKHDNLQLPPNVSLLGWMGRAQIEAHLEEADLVVIPSRWEAFGLVAIEAMRAAKPLVAFRVGALPEIVEDGVTGLLCEPASVAGLATALQQASKLNLPAMGRRGHERFMRLYDVQRTHQTLRQLYLGLSRDHDVEPTDRAAVATR